MRLRHKDVTVTRIIHNGAVECSAIIGTNWWHRVFYGYTKREAVREFCHYYNSRYNKRIV
jgi:hypothetical protein